MNDHPWANKDLGQHFLKDQNVIKSITEDFANECEAIIEVGPGPAVLSEHLAKYDVPYYVIEKDERFPDYLLNHISRDQITIADALQLDINDFIKEKGLEDKKIWLVSNLPYNISVPLTIRFLKAPQIKFMTLMYQKEVAFKIIRGDKKKNYMGSLMALCENLFKSSLLLNVPAGAFIPPPKVESAVISMVRKDQYDVPLEDFSHFESYLRKLFSLKRKQLGKVLKPHYPADRLEKALKECNIERTVRAETFTYEQVINLYNKLR